MINRIDAKLNKMMIHYIGKASEDEGVSYTDNEYISPHAGIEEMLLSLMLDSFQEPEYYTLNQQRKENETLPILEPITSIFADPSTIVDQSKALAKLLHQHSDHPNIKSGDLLVSFIKDVFVDDEIVDALAIVKVENLKSFIQLNRDSDRYDIHVLEGISPEKIDKACLIFNTEAEQGYKICALDKVSRGSEAKFWIDDFLCLEARNDDFYFTKNYIKATKEFIKDRMKPIYETDVADEADIMNRSLNYLTTEEDFDAKEYEKRIFKDESVVADFQDYKKDFANERDVRLADDFKVSPAAIKSQSGVFKSVLKLDKNFHVYIHGKRELIEKGTDEMGRKFYKLYYTEEN